MKILALTKYSYEGTNSRYHLNSEEHISMELKGFEIVEKQLNHHSNCEKYINLLKKTKQG